IGFRFSSNDPTTTDIYTLSLHDALPIWGTMRLGAYKCKIAKGSLAYKIYGKTLIEERHRHRYEFNNKYLEMMDKAGMKASGVNPDRKSTRLNSSHVKISYAVFCLKKKKK